MINNLQTSTPASLHHLHIHSAKPAALAAFYEKQFSLRTTMVGNLHVLEGGARALIISEGVSEHLAAACYALRNPADMEFLYSRLASSNASQQAVDDPLFHSGAFQITDPQGRKMTFGIPSQPRKPDQEPARLQHTVFQTTQLDDVVRFYTQQIGFSISDEVVGDDGRVMVVFLRSDDEHHSLAFFRGANNEWDHHCYETDAWNDIRDWADKFARQRIAIFFGPGRHGPGNNLFFMVTDPDGNRIELSAELELVAPNVIPGVWPQEEHTLNTWGRAWMRS